MLSFKKAGIFSRGSGQEDACEQEDQSGGVLAVWGSPGSGKTTVAVRLAKYLADKRRNVILLLCDMTAPMLPCICPAADLECERSLGSVLAAAHVSENLVKNNLVTHKRLGYLTMLGMLKGENEYTYPPYNEVQARELIDCLREIAPYPVIKSAPMTVINCSSSRSMQSRASSIFCLFSCSTDWAASQMKHPSLWSGLLKRASASGAYRKESSGLSPTRTA